MGVWRAWHVVVCLAVDGDADVWVWAAVVGFGRAASGTESDQRDEHSEPLHFGLVPVVGYDGGFGVCGFGEIGRTWTAMRIAITAATTARISRLPPELVLAGAVIGSATRRRWLRSRT